MQPKFKIKERVYAEVVGGPCGKAIRVPNNKVKRGWSQTRAKWRFEAVETMPLSIRCEGQWYRRVQENGKWFYVHQSTPAVLPRVLAAIGGSPFWHRLFSDLS